MVQISDIFDNPSPSNDVFFKALLFRTPPNFSVTLLSHFKSLITTPKQCNLVKFCSHTVKEGGIWGSTEKKSSLSSHAFGNSEKKTTTCQKNVA